MFRHAHHQFLKMSNVAYCPKFFGFVDKYDSFLFLTRSSTTLLSVPVLFASHIMNPQSAAFAISTSLAVKKALEPDL